MTGILAVLIVIILGVFSSLVLIVLRAGADADVPEAAEAPEYDREPCRPTPVVVAGSDLDRHRRPMPQVNADLSALIDADPQLASLRKLDLSAYYVLPEGDR